MWLNFILLTLPLPGARFLKDYLFNFEGTSAATAIVAGGAALVLRMNPELTATQVLQLLRDTGTALNTGSPKVVAINVLAAVKNSKQV